jgi:hypothetical protein
MQWFGQAYGARYERDTPHTATPVGEPCLWCNEAIQLGDCGLIVGYIDTDVSVTPRHVPYHYPCYVRQIVGGRNHQLHLCHCKGCAGALPPDPQGMTRREAANAALETFETMRTAWHE